LELPKGHQRMVEALVKEHLIKKEAYAKHGKSTPGMDIVAGKGKGLIMLLHGAPGVGKTSTAECVAQSSGRPLFPITCGDLGLEPKEVEDALNDNFRLAALWNCVMLLDEADIFLAKRDKLDMRRNALVSGKSL
jgi:SpoVK/Ycf46/Vps4 family AAA+-type ATPase